MTKYTQPKFSVGGYSKDYADNWDRIFSDSTTDACDICGAALALEYPRKQEELILCLLCQGTVTV